MVPAVCNLTHLIEKHKYMNRVAVKVDSEEHRERDGMCRKYCTGTMGTMIMTRFYTMHLRAASYGKGSDT